MMSKDNRKLVVGKTVITKAFFPDNNKAMFDYLWCFPVFRTGVPALYLFVVNGESSVAKFEDLPFKGYGKLGN